MWSGVGANVGATTVATDTGGKKTPVQQSTGVEAGRRNRLDLGRIPLGSLLLDLVLENGHLSPSSDGVGSHSST